MANKNTSWNIGVGIEIKTSTSEIQKKLNDAAKNVNLNIKAKGAKEASDGISNLSKNMNKASSSAKNFELTYQAANMIMEKSVDIIKSMVSEVYTMNAAQVELAKVTDLSGESMDEYVSKLTDMGAEVAKTGKLWTGARVMGW
nr:MAG TPA: minor tail protein [Bacteriophage sp.]